MPRKTDGFERICIEEIDNMLVAILHGEAGSRPQQKSRCSSTKPEKRKEFVCHWQRVAVEHYLDFEISQGLVIPGLFPV